MSKFFTPPLALLLASVSHVLALEEMKLPPTALPPSPGASDAEAPAMQELPVVLDAGRFAALAKKSPFTLASVTEENADFAKDLILAGYFRIDGKDFVLVANRAQPVRLMVGMQPSAAAQGLTLVKVEKDPSGDPTKMKAQIRKGSETAMLKYEAAGGVAPAAQGGAGQPAPVAAPVQGQTTPAGQPPASPAMNVPPGQKPIQNPPVVRRRQMPIPLPSSR